MRVSVFSVLDHYPQLPRTVTRLFEEVLEQMELADQLGLDGYWIAEHHFHEYGACPSPAVFLAAAAQRTRRLRLGVAVSVLPFTHPLRLAEDWAVLDHLSRGRLNLGVGSGYLQHEFDGFGIDPAEKRSMFDEALIVMRLAWTGEPVRFEGRHYRISGPRLNVLPVQRPHPPVWVAVLRPEAAYYVGRQGLPLINIPYASFDRLDQVPSMVEQFRRGYAESGHNPDEVDLPLVFHTYVADSDRTVRSECGEALERYLFSRLYAKRANYDQLLERGFFIAGSPEKVVEQIRRVRNMTGFNHFVGLVNFGALEHQKVLRSIRLLAEQVAPALRELTPSVRW